MASHDKTTNGFGITDIKPGMMSFDASHLNMNANPSGVYYSVFGAPDHSMICMKKKKLRHFPRIKES